MLYIYIYGIIYHQQKPIYPSYVLASIYHTYGSVMGMGILMKCLQIYGNSLEFHGHFWNNCGTSMEHRWERILVLAWFWMWMSGCLFPKKNCGVCREFSHQLGMAMHPMTCHETTYEATNKTVLWNNRAQRKFVVYWNDQHSNINHWCGSKPTKP